MSLLMKAQMFAIARHGRQMRKHLNEPITRHLDAVVSHLIEHNVTQEEILAAAYLHDVVEDTQTTIEELMEKFGVPVAEMVYWMTDMEVGSRQARRAMLSWRIGRAPWGAKMIQLAEIIDNGATIRIANPPFTAEYLADKSLTLDRMAAVDAYDIMELSLYRTARRMVSCIPAITSTPCASAAYALTLTDACLLAEA